jgi:hypothetical protein
VGAFSRAPQARIWDALPDNATIEQRFPELSGGVLWEVCNRLYVKNVDTSVPIVDANGESLVQRDSTNQRNVASTVVAYTQRFLKEGYYADLRGKLRGLPAFICKRSRFAYPTNLISRVPCKSGPSQSPSLSRYFEPGPSYTIHANPACSSHNPHI